VTADAGGDKGFVDLQPWRLVSMKKQLNTVSL
jgi:hypothetical protein